MINVETLQAAQNFDDMLKIPETKILNGIVVGRVDLVGSMGLDRRSVNSEKVFNITQNLSKKAKQQKMTCVVGGAISVDSLPFLRALSEGLLDRYETRKICFLCPGALGKDAEKGIQKAVGFELLWLQNKQNYYKAISEEDDERISMLGERCQKLSNI
ncbi:unnamed protein product [marine sediment metagenome]|uniref:Uncharacterized protein n=1 Tax=marine sediment metagenome TaxID=412755 RepID=X1C0V1_9ZZZZ